MTPSLTLVRAQMPMMQVVFREHATAPAGRKLLSLFPGLGYAAGYKGECRAARPTTSQDELTPLRPQSCSPSPILYPLPSRPLT